MTGRVSRWLRASPGRSAGIRLATYRPVSPLSGRFAALGDQLSNCVDEVTRGVGRMTTHAPWMTIQPAALA